MGPVDWVAVVIAAVVAAGVIAAWQRAGWRQGLVSLALLAISASMIGHMFARVGADTLHAKPWLYFMMSGGLAGAFIVPALISSQRAWGTPARRIAGDAAVWLGAYLAMGLVFFLSGRIG